jgi:RNA polymerase sigma-70 factor (family 1)
MSVGAEIIQSVKEGSVRAFERLYEAYVDRVYRFSYATLRSADDAREATQDVFVKLWNNRQQLDPAADVAPYLFKICKNHTLNIIRKRKTDARMIEGFYLSQDMVVADDTANMAYARLLEEAINTLPPRRKRIFQLCKIEGLSYKQVAHELQISDGTVEVQVTKALKQIRAHIGNATLVGLLPCLCFITFP